MRSPVLIIAFNRPETTRRVFAAVREAKPPRLYVAVDGPRPGRSGEAERCEEVKRIATSVDWPCEVMTLVRRENLGCRFGPSTAITWFFEHELEGIILEDDCLPSPSFFRYCDQLLESYREDQRVFLISGHNRRDTWKPERHDYFFSNYGGIWGWASWRRAWSHFDGDMADLDACAESGLFENLLGRRGGRARLAAFRRVRARSQDAWDYQWGFARHKNSGLACVPSRNLIQNIGYGPDATHTLESPSKVVALHELQFPLRHNPYMVPDRRYDEIFVEDGLTLRAVVGGVLRRLRRQGV
jgi:hypothetical protein